MKHVASPSCKCCSALRTQLLSRHLLHMSSPSSSKGPVVSLPLTTTRTDCSGATASPVIGRSPVALQLPDDLLDRIQQFAAVQKCSVNDVLESAAEVFLSDKNLKRPGVASESLDSVYVLEPIITLVDGLLHGEHTVAQALTHGDTGLGTLDLLDGEVVVYKGIPYHQSSDGHVQVLTGSEVTPFMTLARQDPQHQTLVQVEEDTNYSGLQRLLKEKVFRSHNVFYVIEIEGKFPSVQARVVRKQDHDRPLVEVAADQALFDFTFESGVLVGFYSPEFMGSSINVPGFHLHYLSDDRKRGGHLLDCGIKAGATISVQEIHRIKVDIPYRDVFMQSHLDRDIKKDIEAAERAKDS